MTLVVIALRLWLVAHPVFVDEIDGKVARIIVDGRVSVVPRRTLPAGAKEGSWVALRRARP